LPVWRPPVSTTTGRVRADRSRLARYHAVSTCAKYAIETNIVQAFPGSPASGSRGLEWSGRNFGRHGAEAVRCPGYQPRTMDRHADPA
jgi:hypothetical protein